MSAIQDILNKIDELVEIQNSQRSRREQLLSNVDGAKTALANAVTAVDAHDELTKFNDDKIEMLKTICIALRGELKAKTEAAKQYFNGIDGDDEKEKFVDFMMTQDVDLTERLVPSAIDSGLDQASTPTPET